MFKIGHQQYNTGRTWWKKGERVSITTEFKSNKINKTCLICQKDFQTVPSAIKRGGGKYCSKQCHGKDKSGKNHPRFKGYEVSCKECNKKFLTIPCLNRQYCGVDCRNEFIRKLGSSSGGISRPTMRGKNHPNYKNGNCKADNRIRHKLMGQIEYKTWRHSIFRRDSFRCLDCGESGYLEAHHIIPYKVAKEKLYDINNGITLCQQCHNKTKGKELELANIYYALVQVQV